MLCLPSAAEPLFMSLSIAYTRPTFQRIIPLIVGAILTLGRRTVTAVLRTLGGLALADPSTYHRVFSRAVWSLWPLGKVLATAILRLIPPEEPVLVPMDDTTTQHRGPNVYGKGRHHDAVRSTHTHVVWRWGHRWVVLAMSVKFPFTSRRWALPVLAALYRPRELNVSEGRRHKTATDLARQMMAVLIHWFPERKFVFLGDGGYACHELAMFCHRHGAHATLVSRFHGNATLHAPPPPPRKGRKGRRPAKGAKLPTPQQMVKKSRRTKGTVSWYGGGQRRVEWVSGTGLWYRSGCGLVPIRWVFVHDLQGTHRDEYFYTTDTSLEPEQIISWFTARWPIETTFQEVRAHLGFETTRQRVVNSVLRTGPCLLGLFSLVSLVFAEHVRRHRVHPMATDWYQKPELTFSDAIATVRRLFWEHSIFEKPADHDTFQKLPARLRLLLLDQLSRAA
jgi:hypothetical protein